MLNAAIFIIGFLVLGLAVLLVAMRGGPRGAREAMHSHSPAGRTITIGAIALAGIGFGVGIPAAVLASNTDEDRNAAGGVRLTAEQADGRSLYVEYCATCHTLDAANASGRVGPNLDKLRPPRALVLNAILEGRAQGRGQMPANLVTGDDAKDVAAFVAAVAGRERLDPEAP